MFPTLTPITKNIIIINIIVYLISNFIQFPFFYNILSGYFPLSPNFHYWQIISHMFMHAPLQGGGGIGISHIIFNMLSLWSFGPILEKSLGDKKFLILYFLSGIGGFVLFNLYNYIEIQQLINSLTSQGINVSEIFAKANISYQGEAGIIEKNPEATSLYIDLVSPMMGASGAVIGLVAAFATLFSEAKIIFLLIPIPMKAKYLLPIIILGSIYLGLKGNVGGIAHFAHAGGAIVGYLLARNWKNNRYRIN